MRTVRLVTTASIGAIIGTVTIALADETHRMILLPDAEAVHWGAAPPTLPKSVQFAVLVGDPAKPGPFVLRVKIPPNTAIAPHACDR